MAISEYLKRVYGGTAEEYARRAEEAMERGERLFVVTANPEILMHGERDPKIRELLLSETAEIVPDGVSVVKAMNMLGLPAKERITGVDLAGKLLEAAGKGKKSVFLLGAKEEVVSTLAGKLRRKYPGISLRFRNGYDGDKDQIFEEIAALAPDLVLVGLGVPAQELLICRHLEKFSKGVLMGVGGSFDVLSGSKRRAPAVFVKTNTEWLYRIAREPQRLGRFWNNNVKFLGAVKKAAKK
ncbi:glycosyltransferase [Acutalibacter sp. 1XD8-33]|uniref:WecB/TagA/CpsF family glycosyltransferase n=1 Tax=Acutalibacter sp. 1XD8-33 TaxID=2320081 RepID=UPI000EA35752|nr:WecB/TagA/CpsF family glycosyltransferase [Acutalibacter sp. 1XD8-33]RKJ40534.1 glycosyltransferase [Acutalibacter sp. 1XD8-33]